MAALLNVVPGIQDTLILLVFGKKNFSGALWATRRMARLEPKTSFLFCWSS
jgi:hypothetical protein